MIIKQGYFIYNSFMKKATKEEIKEIHQLFIDNYSDAVTELDYKNAYELVVAVALSAQCTDKRVNLITPTLFERYPDTKSLAIADIKDVKNIINSCSFFNNKAKNIIHLLLFFNFLIIMYKKTREFIK